MAYEWKKDAILRDLRNKAHFLYAKEGDDVAAFARTSDRPEKSVLIEELYTNPEYRGQGYGTQLLQAVINGTEGEVLAKTKADNEKMIRLLQLHGFSISRPGERVIEWKREKTPLRKDGS